MVFTLVRKGGNKIPEGDYVVINKASVRFPIKLRKKKVGFYNYVNIYLDKKKIGFEFTDDVLTGYTLLKSSLGTQGRMLISSFRPGVYDYKKEGSLYVIYFFL